MWPFGMSSKVEDLKHNIRRSPDSFLSDTMKEDPTLSDNYDLISFYICPTFNGQTPYKCVIFHLAEDSLQYNWSNFNKMCDCHT